MRERRPLAHHVHVVRQPTRSHLSLSLPAFPVDHTPHFCLHVYPPFPPSSFTFYVFFANLLHIQLDSQVSSPLASPNHITPTPYCIYYTCYFYLLFSNCYFYPYYKFSHFHLLVKIRENCFLEYGKTKYLPNLLFCI